MHVYHSRLLLVALVALILAALFLPFYGVFEGYEVFLTIFTFLFSILAGFTLAAVREEYSAMGEAVSKENAIIITIYNLMKGFDKKSQMAFVELLDRYLVLSHAILWSEFYKTNKLFNKLSYFLLCQKIKNKTQEVIYDDLLENMPTWSAARQDQIYLSYRRIPFPQMGLLILLAGLLILFLFIVRTPSLASILTTVLFSFTIILTLVLIYSLDIYAFAPESWTEPSEHIFDMIGKKRFYMEDFTKKGWIIPPKGGEYRSKVPKDYLNELND